ncbi:MAG: hypothetical protein ACXAD7_08170 [Candidatus Kariarchaeaceae archaeon]|jgi:hypothetical protein
MSDIHQITIMKPNGLVIYHKSFDGHFDEILFSGFTAALLGLSNELGGELVDFNIGGGRFYFKKSGLVYIVLGVNPKIDIKCIKSIFLTITNAKIFEDIQKLAENHIIRYPIELEYFFSNLLDQMNLLSDSAEIQEYYNKMFGDLNQIIDLLKEEKYQPKTIAKAIIEQSGISIDINSMIHFSEFLSQFVSSQFLVESIRGRFKDLIEYLTSKKFQAAYRVEYSLF